MYCFVQKDKTIVLLILFCMRNSEDCISVLHWVFFPNCEASLKQQALWTGGKHI